MRVLLQDVRFSLRQLRKSPGFALTSILTLALGIGGVTAIFSVVHGVLLKPFPLRDPGKLVIMRETVRELNASAPVLPDNFRHYLRLKHDSRTLQDAAIFDDHAMSVAAGKDHPRIVGGLRVSSNFFSVLGVEPVLGRAFTPQEQILGHENVVILSYHAWKTLFNGDPNVLGKTLLVGGIPEPVVGVLPQTFRFPVVQAAPNISIFAADGDMRPYEIFQPFARYPDVLADDIYDYNYSVIARLRPGVTIAQASAELESLQRAHTLAAHLPIQLGISLRPFDTDVTGSVSGALWLLFAAAGAVLLIACANLANLQLARSVSRERETAVRAALGASRVRLFRSRLMESVVLAVIGGAAGVALALFGVRGLLAAAPANMPRIAEVQISWTVLIFAVALSLLTALFFGILPALRSLLANPQQAMQIGATRVVNIREGSSARNLLVASEVACAVVLLIVTGLALRSLSYLLHQKRGFDAGHVILAQVDLFAPQYADSLKNVNAVKAAFLDRTLEGLSQLPGVREAAMTSAMPLTGNRWIEPIARPGDSMPEGQEPQANARWVSPSYFSVLRIPVTEGRVFSLGDRNHRHVLMLSQKAARDVFPDEDPIGRTVRFEDAFYTVVGLVADTRINNLKTSVDMVYLPYWERPPWTISFLVRGSQSSDALAPEIRRAIWQVDPQVAIPVLKSMDNQISNSVATDRFTTLLLCSFGVAALLLALLGVYGVLAYSVSLRKQEFGIRIALGSDKAALVKLVLRQAGYPVLGGLFVGLICSFAATRYLHSLLYDAKTVDPIAISGGVLLLLGASFLAATLPAHRAAQVDPMQVLRDE